MADSREEGLAQQDPDLEGTPHEPGGEEQVPTGLGSGAASGLGHSQTSEPEDLLDAGTGTVDEDRGPDRATER